MSPGGSAASRGAGRAAGRGRPRSSAPSGAAGGAPPARPRRPTRRRARQRDAAARPAVVAAGPAELADHLPQQVAGLRVRGRRPHRQDQLCPRTRPPHTAQSTSSKRIRKSTTSAACSGCGRSFTQLMMSRS